MPCSVCDNYYELCRRHEHNFTGFLDNGSNRFYPKEAVTSVSIGLQTTSVDVDPRKSLYGPASPTRTFPYVCLRSMVSRAERVPK